MLCAGLPDELNGENVLFGLIFSNVAVILTYMLLGYLLSKAGKVQLSHAKSLSALLLFVLSPAMIINSFLQLSYTKENLFLILRCFLTTLVLQLLFMGVLAAIFRKKYADSRYRILTIGSVLGNVGFFGMPVISSIFPDNPIVMCYSSITVMSMNLIVFTIGVFFITNDKSYISVRSAVLNPTTLSIFVALPLFLFRVQLPAAAMGCIGTLASMVTPLCMMILGMRLSATNLRVMFTRSFAYLTSFFKLIVFPVFVFLCIRKLPFLDSTLKTSLIVLAAAPSGAVIESLAELHECEQELSANVVLLTTILSVLTVPVVASLLV